MRLQGGLDLGQLDAVAPHLDLQVLAAQELDAPVRQVAAHVPGPVEALAAQRVPDEAGRRLLGVAEVAGRQARAGDEELARHPVRARAERGVQHVEALVRQRLPVGDAPPLGRHPLDPVEDRPDGGLGGAAQADELDVRQAPPHLVRQGDRDPVPAQQRQPQRGQLEVRLRGQVVAQHLHLRRYRVPEVDAVLGGQLRPVRRVAAAAGVREDHRAPDRGRAEQVVDREVEPEAGQAEHALADPDAEPPVDVLDGVDRGAVRDHDALGRPGRARRVDDVGEVVRPGEALRQDGRRGRRPDGVHGQRGQAGRPGAGGQPRLGEHVAGPGVRQHPVPAHGRLAGVDRDVGGAGQQRPQHGHHLLPALVHDGGHQLARPAAGTAQALGHGRGAAQQLGEGERAAAGDDGGQLRRPQRLRHQALVEQRVRQRRAGCVGGPAAALLGGRQPDRAGRLPGRRARGQAPEQVLEGAERVVDQPLGEHAIADVPVDRQPAPPLRGLAVDPHLGRLADAAGQLAELRQVVVRRAVVAQPDRAGEHDREQGRALAVAAGELAHDLHAGAVPVVEVLPEPFLQRAGALPEAGVRPVLDGQQLDRREVADQLADLGVQGQTVEQGHVQGELPSPAPAADHLGVGGQHGAGGGQPQAGGPVPERPPPVRRERQLPPGEPRRRAGGGRQHRQVRGRRQLVEAVPPVRAVPLVPGAGAQAPLRQEVVAERDLQGWQRPVRQEVAPAQLVQENLDADEVGDQEVDREVEQRAPGGQRHAELEERPAIGRPHAVVHLVARGPDRIGGRAGRGPAHIEGPDLVVGDLREHPLRAVGADDGPQHGVAAHHVPPGALQAPRVQLGTGQLAVAVAGDAPEREDVAPAEQVGGLHVGEREGLVPLLGPGRQQRREGGAAERLDHRLPVGAERREPGLRHDAPGGAVAQLPGLLPDPGAGALELGDQVDRGHTIPSSNSPCRSRSPAISAARPPTVGRPKICRSVSSTPKRRRTASASRVATRLSPPSEKKL